MKPALVLDLAGPSSVYGTRLLAEAGHRVVRVEPPGGDAVRRTGPFVRGHDDLEHGALHLYMNAGKESFALAFDAPDASDTLRALVRAADVAVLPRPLSCPAEALLEANPRLALVEVEEAANELCAYARSGLLALTGHPNEEPVVLGGHAPFAAIGAYVAVAAAAALLSARTSGSAVRVEVSALNCLQALAEQSILKAFLTGEETVRRGSGGEITVSGVLASADGAWQVSPGTQATWDRLVAWTGDPVLADASLATDEARLAKRDFILGRLETWARRRPKAELVEEAQARRVPAAPVATTADLADDPQLLARGFLREIDHPLLGRMRFPAGALASLENRVLSPAPRLGQNTAAIRREFGIAVGGACRSPAANTAVAEMQRPR